MPQAASPPLFQEYSPRELQATLPAISPYANPYNIIECKYNAFRLSKRFVLVSDVQAYPQVCPQNEPSTSPNSVASVFPSEKQYYCPCSFPSFENSFPSGTHSANPSNAPSLSPSTSLSMSRSLSPSLREDNGRTLSYFTLYCCWTVLLGELGLLLGLLL